MDKSFKESSITISFYAFYIFALTDLIYSYVGEMGVGECYLK